MFWEETQEFLEELLMSNIGIDLRLPHHTKETHDHTALHSRAAFVAAKLFCPS
jgi:hypothetical protein